jgi:hypothetical protein
MKLQFYVTDFASNGCQDLLAIDSDGNVVDSCRQGIYGLHVRPGSAQVVLNDQLIVDPEMRLSAVESGDPNLNFVYRAALNVLKRHIAVSPTSNGSEVESFIEKYSKMG